MKSEGMATVSERVECRGRRAVGVGGSRRLGIKRGIG